MWSRKAMPLARSVRPVPSIVTRTAMSVSFVRRSTYAVRSGHSDGAFISVSLFVGGVDRPGRTSAAVAARQRRDDGVVLRRRSDGDAQAIRKQRMPAIQVLDEDARVAKRREPRGRVG